MPTDARQPRVLHVITGLDTGGAEMMLLKLLEALGPAVPSCVIVLMGRGALAARVEALGVPVHYLSLGQGALPGPGTVRRLLGLAREFGPSVVQGWMYHGNLAAWLVAIGLRPRPALVWNIRQTLYQLGREKLLTRWIIKAGALLSRSPDRIVYNSSVSAAQHERAGYRSSCRLVIPNGFDIERFRPDPAAREAVRREFGLPDGARLVGHVARYHPMKDHATLLHAACAVMERYDDVRLLMTGRGVTPENPALAGLVRELGLTGRVILAGERGDVPRIMASLDVAVSASAWGEGFPNVVGEAMAAGVPCVVTDIGDSAHVVGDCGRVVPPGDAQAMAAAIGDLLDLDDGALAALAAAARQRVADMFSRERVGGMYLDLYRTVARP